MHTTEEDGRKEAQLHSFLTSVLGGAECFPAASFPVKTAPRWALNRSLGEPQSQAGRFVEKQIFMCLEPNCYSSDARTLP